MDIQGKELGDKLSFAKELGEIVQVGIVVEDLEKVKRGMLDLFGMEPDAGGEFLYPDCLYRTDGERIDAPVLSAFYNCFKVQLEFLQPIGEVNTVWSDYLKAGQSGLHHVRFDVADNDRITETMARHGINIWMEGRSLIDPKAKFTYYDSREALGFIIEVVTRT